MWVASDNGADSKRQISPGLELTKLPCRRSWRGDLTLFRCSEKSSVATPFAISSTIHVPVVPSFLCTTSTKKQQNNNKNRRDSCKTRRWSAHNKLNAKSAKKDYKDHNAPIGRSDNSPTSLRRKGRIFTKVQASHSDDSPNT